MFFDMVTVSDDILCYDEEGKVSIEICSEREGVGSIHFATGGEGKGEFFISRKEAGGVTSDGAAMVNQSRDFGPSRAGTILANMWGGKI